MKKPSKTSAAQTESQAQARRLRGINTENQHQHHHQQQHRGTRASSSSSKKRSSSPTVIPSPSLSTRNGQEAKRQKRSTPADPRQEEEQEDPADDVMLVENGHDSAAASAQLIVENEAVHQRNEAGLPASGGQQAATLNSVTAVSASGQELGESGTQRRDIKHEDVEGEDIKTEEEEKVADEDVKNGVIKGEEVKEEEKLQTGEEVEDEAITSLQAVSDARNANIEAEVDAVLLSDILGKLEEFHGHDDHSHAAFGDSGAPNDATVWGTTGSGPQVSIEQIQVEKTGEAVGQGGTEAEDIVHTTSKHADTQAIKHSRDEALSIERAQNAGLAESKASVEPSQSDDIFHLPDSGGQHRPEVRRQTEAGYSASPVQLSQDLATQTTLASDSHGLTPDAASSIDKFAAEALLSMGHSHIAVVDESPSRADSANREYDISLSTAVVNGDRPDAVMSEDDDQQPRRAGQRRSVRRTRLKYEVKVTDANGDTDLEVLGTRRSKRARVRTSNHLFESDQEDNEGNDDYSQVSSRGGKGTRQGKVKAVDNTPEDTPPVKGKEKEKGDISSYFQTLGQAGRSPAAADLARSEIATAGVVFDGVHAPPASLVYPARDDSYPNTRNLNTEATIRKDSGGNSGQPQTGSSQPLEPIDCEQEGRDDGDVSMLDMPEPDMITTGHSVGLERDLESRLGELESLLESFRQKDGQLHSTAWALLQSVMDEYR
ncbi:uncharacterized protein B0I36DRAFT_360964 [Microdochium trichocladiopsis]|uniref:Uncharacterized protein n=1 Tax=Microdochium trichocladiopsis TaxID=1682393 RepID=A0A9P9BX10_9PEZI|nr:uncharacterized protein B0I36DRAFT_360964 [Microdochium trichocladiopsis]KAH7035626.1 hypothetical protein B0I36DRAFT_360964 [Microdochium trichocladiopsis]